MSNTCILIPIFNNKTTIAAVLDEIEGFQLPCLIVDDGSDAETGVILERESGRREWVRVLHRARNGGKGAAVKDGLIWAGDLGFENAIQIDADGQHDTRDIPRFLAHSAQDPGCLVLGDPQFGEDVPKSRLYGREISKFWVRIETLSTAIADPLCGFRLYPVRASVALVRSVFVGNRMDFDPEIAVKLYWFGVKVKNQRTAVHYPAGGISHFRMVRDNLRISLMHTRLVLGMLVRLPRLLTASKPGR